MSPKRKKVKRLVLLILIEVRALRALVIAPAAELLAAGHKQLHKNERASGSTGVLAGQGGIAIPLLYGFHR